VATITGPAAEVTTTGDSARLQLVSTGPQPGYFVHHTTFSHEKTLFLD
jgi:hypothetical protein